MTEDEFERARSDAGNLACGCNDQESRLEVYVKILRALADNLKWDAVEPLLPPAPWTFIPLDHLESFDLIEHGSNAMCSWITPRGIALLAFLERCGCDDRAWPDEYDVEGELS